MIIMLAARPRFPLGRVLMTPGVEANFTPEQVTGAIRRHASGDWGEVGATDAQENENSLKLGYRIMSVYSFDGKNLWVITERDRSSTTVLLPEEY